MEHLWKSLGILEKSLDMVTPSHAFNLSQKFFRCIDFMSEDTFANRMDWHFQRQ